MATCYVLSMEVQPGGARESSHWVCNSWDEVRNQLLDDLASQNGIFMTLYGRRFTIRLIENGRITATYNPKKWIHFVRIGEFANPQFNLDHEYGSPKLPECEELDEQLFTYDDDATVDGDTIRHPLYELEIHFPHDVKQLVGNANEQSHIQMDNGVIRYPYTSWE